MGETLIQDPDKAYVMALAGDKDRTRAAKHSLAATAVREFFAGFASGSEILRYQATQKFNEAIETLSPIISRSGYMWNGDPCYLYMPSTFHYAFSGAPYGFWTKEDQDNFKNSLREQHEANANAADSFNWSADRIEDIAGFLYDHPVSEELKAANPDINFTPEGLIDLNYKIKEAREIARARFKSYRSYFDPEWGSKHLPSHLARTTWYDNYDEPVLHTKNSPEVEALLNDPNATVQQLNDFFSKGAREQAVESAKSYIRLYKIRRAVFACAPNEAPTSLADYSFGDEDDHEAL